MLKIISTATSLEEVIDCNFPYENTRLGDYLIVHACRDLGDSAVFSILYEVLFPPKSSKISKRIRLYYLDSIRSYWAFMYKSYFLELAEKRILGYKFSESEILNCLHQKDFHFTNTSLNIIELLFDGDSNLLDREIEAIRIGIATTTTNASR